MRLYREVLGRYKGERKRIIKNDAAEKETKIYSQPDQRWKIFYPTCLCPPGLYKVWIGAGKASA